MRALFLALGICLGALSSANGQNNDPSVGLRPLEQMLERPYVMRLWRSNRAFLELNFLDLDEATGALAAKAPSNDIFDVDVYVMFLRSFAEPGDDVGGHFLEELVRRNLKDVAPGTNLRMFRVPLTRNEDGAQKRLNVILAETEGLRELSDLCLATALYDMGRWFFSSSIQVSVPRATQRGATCLVEKWTTMEQVLNFQAPDPI